MYRLKMKTECPGGKVKLNILCSGPWRWANSCSSEEVRAVQELRVDLLQRQRRKCSGRLKLSSERMERLAVRGRCEGSSVCSQSSPQKKLQEQQVR